MIFMTGDIFRWQQHRTGVTIILFLAHIFKIFLTIVLGWWSVFKEKEIRFKHNSQLVFW